MKKKHSTLSTEYFFFLYLSPLMSGHLARSTTTYKKTALASYVCPLFKG